MRAAVLGSPIGHSLSPVLHRAAYAALALTGWSYEAIECDEAGLPRLLASLGPDWAGLSLTMPLKRAVLPLLEQADKLVTEVGAANTVVLAGGTAAGYNTDVPGMVTALAEAGVRADCPVLILGGGATACSAVAALHRAGAQQATVAVRDPVTAERLLAVAGRAGITVDLVTFGPGPRRDDWLAAGWDRPWSVLLSTVPGQAADGYAELLATGQLRAGAVFDVVYQPWPTRLAAAGAAAGLPVVGGFELLLHQAAEQVRLMTGRPAPVEAMRAAGLTALAARGG
ncbi:MAG TPA: shikimate dehydrogenase [Streptosporangiaceae bacterium]|nr:shikimate dehydrogenase [Streptosporangiaceae bacterium]